MKKDLVAAGFIVDNDKVLLIHHKKLKKWLPAGGHIEANETPEEALRREMMEELGIEIELPLSSNIPLDSTIRENISLPFDINVHSVGDHDHCCLFYLCKPKGSITINKNELNDAKWFSYQDLDSSEIGENIMQQAKKALELAKEEK